MSESGALFVSARKHYKLPARQGHRPISRYWRETGIMDKINSQPSLHHHHHHDPCCDTDASNPFPAGTLCEDDVDFHGVHRKADRQASVSSTSTIYTSTTENAVSSATDLTTDEETSDKEEDAIFSPVDSQTVTPAESVPVSPTMKIELHDKEAGDVAEIPALDLPTPTPGDRKLVDDDDVSPVSSNPTSTIDETPDLFPAYTFTPAVVKHDTYHLPSSISTSAVLTVIVTDLEPGDRPYYPYLGGIDLSYKACKQYERDGQQKLWPYWKPNGGVAAWESSDAGDAGAFRGVGVGWEKDEDREAIETLSDEDEGGDDEEWESDEEDGADEESDEESDEDFEEYDTGDIEVVFG